MSRKRKPCEGSTPDRSVYPTVLFRPGEAVPEDPPLDTVPNGLEMMADLARTAWTFKDGVPPPERLRRDVVRTIRRKPRPPSGSAVESAPVPPLQGDPMG